MKLFLREKKINLEWPRNRTLDFSGTAFHEEILLLGHDEKKKKCALLVHTKISSITYFMINT
jgi:hypothetical protein